MGPIGAHLSLLDATWADAAEIALGDVLDVWIADNRADKQVGPVSAEPLCPGRRVQICAGRTGLAAALLHFCRQRCLAGLQQVHCVPACQCPVYDVHNLLPCTPVIAHGMHCPCCNLVTHVRCAGAC